MDRKYKISTDETAFENLGVVVKNGDCKANFGQIRILYDVKRQTLYDTISKLKKDGLIISTETRKNSQKGRPPQCYDLQSIIAIGLRLRNEKAIRFQKWAISLIKAELQSMTEKYHAAKISSNIAWRLWDQEDKEDYHK